MLQQAVEAVSQTLFKTFVLNGLPMRNDSTVLLYRKASTRQRTSQSWGKGCRTSIRAHHRHIGQGGSMAVTVKRDFKTGPKRGNCFAWTLCPGLQEKGERTMQQMRWEGRPRQGMRDRDGRKHESVAIGPTMATPDEENWAALSQWKTTGMLVDSGCTDHRVTNIEAFLDFVPMQSVVRNPNGEAFRVVVRACVRISITSNEKEFQCNSRMFCVCLTIPQTSYQSQDAGSADIASLSRKDIAVWNNRRELG